MSYIDKNGAECNNITIYGLHEDIQILQDKMKILIDNTTRLEASLDHLSQLTQQILMLSQTQESLLQKNNEEVLDIKETSVGIEKSCQKMDDHISFINSTYNGLKPSLNFLTKIGPYMHRMVPKFLTNRQNLIYELEE